MPYCRYSLPVEHRPQTTDHLSPSSSVLCCHLHLPQAAVLVSCCAHCFLQMSFPSVSLPPWPCAKDKNYGCEIPGNTLKIYRIGLLTLVRSSVSPIVRFKCNRDKSSPVEISR